MQFRRNIIREKCQRQSLLSRKEAHQLIIFCLVNICTALDIDSIDKNHIAMFPYCGSMSQTTSETQARAINAEDSKLDYRWSAIIEKKNTEPKTGTVVEGTMCSGSIITDR